MNIAHPIASTIEAVDFATLTEEDVRKVSVKRITNPIALDGLLHPTPGGLHDLALGSFTDNPCATCGLLGQSCPGHCGHIELPVPVYHCTYVEQMFKYLRAQCYYCHRLKLSRIQANEYWAKLQLLRHGLIDAAKKVPEVGVSEKTKDVLDADSEDDADSQDGETDRIIDNRKAFVKRCLKDAGVDMRRPVYLGDRSEAVAEARKRVLIDFHREITSIPKCRNCGAFSAKYRKNRATSIFRKPMALKEKAKNSQAGIKTAEHPLELLIRLQKQREEKQRRRAARRESDAMDIDEGIADMETADEEIRVLDGPSTFDMEIDDATGEISSSEDGEDLVNGDNIIAGEASSVKKKAKSKEDQVEAQVYVNASEVRALLMHLFEREQELFSQIYGSASVTASPEPPSANMFFLKSIIVTPNKYRKEQKSGIEIAESPDNAGYRSVLTVANEVVEIQREVRTQQASYAGRIRSFDDLQNACIRLQDAVNTFIDKDKNPAKGPARLRIPEGIKQKLEKKEGLFRMNIMGKRVNFAARSVISPDPNIESNEIGVPPVFAEKLTYPEPVTAHNVDKLRDYVLNGHKKWPGAHAVEYENGQVVNLAHKNLEERRSIANLLLAPSSTAMTGNRNKKVHRHLMNGDMLIMNRQPTLHKPSMMCHKARVLTGERTIRMHYANCKTYNADFDGDEMNMHFPQNEIARAEAALIADNDHQYLSATAGEPLRGLIQDHISICVALTSLDTFFNREEYQQLLYSSLRPEHNHTTTSRIQLLEPDILKPAPRWTGKQVVSTILLNIQPEGYEPLNVSSKPSVKPELWGPASEEGMIRVKSGLLLTGIMDKKQIGPASGGLIHAVYETYGHEAAGKFLSILGRLLTRLLNVKAFSCGVEDLVLTKQGEAARNIQLREANAAGLQVSSKYVGLEKSSPRATSPLLLERLEQVLRDDSKQAELDAVMSSAGNAITTSISSACLPHNLIKQFPQNQMQVMTGSGAKGSVVNANLISCALGQQVLEGRRVPTMVSGKTLPTFRPFDSSLRAGGYITDRFLTGVRPQEYYFHAMAGREGLIDTAVKTSRSGYLQRCLIKGMEGLRADYDGSVRDADGTLVQTLYGEDGLDITKQALLTNFDLITGNLMSVFAKLDVEAEKLQILANAKERLDEQKAMTQKIKEFGLLAPDPVISRYPPAANAGSVSEKYWQQSSKYFSDNKERLRDLPKPIKKVLFQQVTAMNYLKAVVDAGEAVGVVAGQSLGEPSTQMTLNTFHLAGHSAKNVTLGIPRLREILMTASMKIKTPTMQLVTHEELSVEDAKRFAKGISRLKLAEVIDTVSVKEQIGQGIYAESRMYDVQIKFWPAKDYVKEYAITIEDVARTVETHFLTSAVKFIKADLKKRGEEKLLKASDAQPEVGKASRVVREEAAVQDAENEGGDSDDESAGDDDAYDAKKRKQQDEGQTYEDPDEEEEELAAEESEEDDGDSEHEDEGYGGSPAPSDADSDTSGGNHQQTSKFNRPSKLGATVTQERQNRVLNRFAPVTAFAFDAAGGFCNLRFEFPADTAKLLMLAIVNRAAHEALVQSIEGITSAIWFDPALNSGKPGEKPYVLTEGCNLIAMRDYQNVVNPNFITTNSVGDMLTHFGVEAARETIIRELRAVFSGHSIDVNQRHLTLVADYMTRKGGYSAFNRMGMMDKTSPFMKMSFETTFGVLRDAVFDGDRDRLDTPSGRITVGKIGRMGTGMCDVMMAVS